MMLSLLIPRRAIAAALLLGAAISVETRLNCSEAPENSTSPISRKDMYGDALPDNATLRLGTQRLRPCACVAVAPDGKTLATGYGNDIRLWDTASSKETARWSMQFKHGAQSLLFAQDGRLLIAVGRLGNEYEAWDVAERKRVSENHAPSRVAAAELVTALPALSLHGNTLFVGNGVAIHGWDLATGKETYQFTFADDEKTRANTIVISTASNMFVTGHASSRTVRLWDTERKELLHTFSIDGFGVKSAAFSRDGSLLTAGADDGTVYIWDVKTGHEVGKLRGSNTQVIALSFSPDGKTLAAASNEAHWSAGSGEQAIRLWDLAEKARPRATITAPGVDSVTFSPDCKTLVWVACGHSVRLLDIASCKEINTVDSHHGVVYSVAFSPDGRQLASASADHTIRLWNTQNGKTLKVLQGHADEVYSLSWSPDGKWLASGSRDRTLVLWDAESGKLVFRSAAHLNELRAVAFSPDSKLLATGALDYKVRLWEVATGKLIHTLERPKQSAYALGFSPDGKLLAVGGDEGVRLYDRKTLNVTDLFETKGRVTSLSFSPDGKTLVSCSTQFLLWEVATGKQRAHVAGHAGQHTGVAFSPDGRLVALAGCQTDNPYGSRSALRVLALANIPEAATVRDAGMAVGVAFSSDGRLATASDSTALIWDTAAVAMVGGQKVQSATVDGKELAGAWSDLAEDDSAKAFIAFGRLVTASAQAVPLMRQKMMAVAEPKAQEVASLIADLNSDKYETRENASSRLAKFAELAEPALRKALADSPPETKVRIGTLLEAVGDQRRISGEPLRGLRAVEVLEHIGTPEASKVLETLASGAEGARLTRDAKAALERLGKRSQNR